MVMPNEIPRGSLPTYIRPEKPNYRYITMDTMIAITEEGKDALESGQLSGAEAELIDELSTRGFTSIYRINDKARLNIERMRPVIVSLARKGLIHISRREEGR